jgi:hypothetical protein
MDDWLLPLSLLKTLRKIAYLHLILTLFEIALRKLILKISFISFCISLLLLQSLEMGFDKMILRGYFLFS